MNSEKNSIEALKDSLKAGFKGDVDDSAAALATYSHDASLLEVRPRIVLFPKDADDIKTVVRFVHENKAKYPDLSITVRAAGSDMSGGPLNDSIILDVTKYMRGIKSITKHPTQTEMDSGEATVLPGMFYRDFEPEAAKLGLLLPCYTASKNLNTLGGMVGNNSAGEKTLRYGKTEDFIKQLRVVFADGNEYVVKPLSKAELDRKIAQNDFEASVYREIWDIVSKNSAALAKAKPRVSKNSAGYYLWNVWDGRTFDLTKLIVGSQGTLGIATEVTFRLVPIKPLSKLFVVFMPSLDHLGEIVRDIAAFRPESFESYDDSTMALAVKFMPDMLRTMHLHNFARLLWSFRPEAWMALSGGFPKLVLLVEFCGSDATAIDAEIDALEAKIRHYGFKMRRAKNEFDSEKYWTIRRESFNLLRKHVKGRRTAPFVDDIIVPPETMPEFLPKMRKILDEYKLLYTIAGHAGNGNFHIIPLMDMRDPANARAIDEVSDKVYDLVLSYGGSITAEHNDGIIRTPYLAKQFGSEIVALFKRAKDAFDPEDIFNPGKKVPGLGPDAPGTKAYMMEHLARS
ncbi:MAG: FAD-binding oxidoreductase [Patescibacteria group bacterium]|nr:FAD-binding oxidoreductase [Patescibacteria group bacterium]MDE2116672.1 FAD-binding oxidoreductase [Patescibacteria group bacterium]